MRRALLVSSLIVGVGCSLTAVPDLSSGRGAADGGASPVVDGSDPGVEAAPGADASAGYRAAVLAAGPIAYYRFEEASGAAAHDERGGPDAVLGAGVTLGAAGFTDGSRAARLTPGAPAITGPSAIDFVGRQAFTFEAWIFTRSFPTGGGHGMIFFKGDGVSGAFQESGAYVQAPNQLVFERYVDGVENTVVTTIPADRFVHIALTYDGTTLRAFVDGVLGGERKDERDQPAKPPPIAFGFDPAGGTGTSFFDGTVDEIALYDRALGEPEIAAHARVHAP